jgi:hypothetical protein
MSGVTVSVDRSDQVVRTGGAPRDGGSTSNYIDGQVHGNVIQSGKVTVNNYPNHSRITPDKLGRTGLVAAAVVAVVLLLASVSSTPVAPTSTPTDVVGDPRTADPCALANVAQPYLIPYGRVQVNTHVGNFSRCDLMINLADVSDPVDVEFQFPETDEAPKGPPITRTGAISVELEQQDGNECDRDLSGRNLNIDISASSEKPPDNLCQIIESAMDPVVSWLNGLISSQAQIPRRVLPQDSLAKLNACGLLDSAALSHVDVDPRLPEAGFANWQCSWGDDDARSVNLSFDQNSPPGIEHDFTDKGGGPLGLGEYPAFVMPSGDNDSGNNCVVEIEYRPFRYQGSLLAEWIRLVMDGPQPPVPSETLCMPTRILAADVLSHLPR